MKFTLIEDWKQVLQKAWSIKWSLAAAALGALELAIPQIPADILPPGMIPRGTLAILAILLNTVIIPAVRVLAQEEKQNVSEAPANGK